MLKKTAILMGKLHTKFLILCSFLILLGCTEKDQFISKIEKKFNTKIEKSIKKVYIIEDSSATCNTCFNEFTKWIYNKELNNDELLLINNTRDLIDIDPFLNKKNCLITFDKKNRYAESSGLSILYLSNQKVDSIINITPNNIYSVLTRE